jgi:tetratricopeptide (TPR) repeat protein
MAARRTDEALPHFTKAYDAAQSTLGPTDRLTRGYRGRRALALAYAGAAVEARREMQAMLEPSRRETPDERYLWLRYSGQIERIEGNFEGALELQEEAFQIAEKEPGPFRRPMTLLEIGMLRVELGDHEGAVAALEEVRKTLSTDAFEPNDAEILIGLGRAKLGQNRPSEAVPLLEEAERFWREFDPRNRWAGEASLWLSDGYAALGRASESAEARKRAIDILSRSSDPSAKRLLRIARRTD